MKTNTLLICGNFRHDKSSFFGKRFVFQQLAAPSEGNQPGDWEADIQDQYDPLHQEFKKAHPVEDRLMHLHDFEKKMALRTVKDKLAQFATHVENTTRTTPKSEDEDSAGGHLALIERLPAKIADVRKSLEVAKRFGLTDELHEMEVKFNALAEKAWKNNLTIRMQDMREAAAGLKRSVVKEVKTYRPWMKKIADPFKWVWDAEVMEVPTPKSISSKAFNALVTTTESEFAAAKKNGVDVNKQEVEFLGLKKEALLISAVKDLMHFRSVADDLVDHPLTTNVLQEMVDSLQSQIDRMKTTGTTPQVLAIEAELLQLSRDALFKNAVQTLANLRSEIYDSKSSGKQIQDFSDKVKEVQAAIDAAKKVGMDTFHLEKELTQLNRPDVIMPFGTY